MEQASAVRQPNQGSREIVTVDQETSVAVAAGIMRDNRIGCLVVTGSGGRLVGILSERDIVRRLVVDCASPSDVLVRQIMTTDVACCAVGTQLGTVQAIMTARGIRHLPVVDNGIPVGMISSREVMASHHAIEEGMRDMTIFALAKLAESRDPETGRHLERVRTYAFKLAQDLEGQERFSDQIDAEFLRLIYLTSPLHDVGKVGIPDHVLLKPGRLDDHEFAIMKTHCARGAQTLDLALKRYPQAEFLRMARDIAACHHERVDGRGYPDGKTRDQIPLAARIFSLADIYDALVSRRVYKDAYTHEIARSIVLEGKGTQLDPEVVEAFLHCEQAFRTIRDQYDEARTAA